MRSGELIKQTKITRDTLRYYNRLGFLIPVVKENGYKEYSQEDVWMVEFIKSAQNIGFSLKNIKELAEQMKSAECRHRSLIPFLKNKLEEVDTKVKALKKIQKHLKYLIVDFEKKDCSKHPSELKL